MKSSAFKEVKLNVVNVGKAIVCDVIRRAKIALSNAFHRQNNRVKGQTSMVEHLKKRCAPREYRTIWQNDRGCHLKRGLQYMKLKLYNQFGQHALNVLTISNNVLQKSG